MILKPYSDFLEENLFKENDVITQEKLNSAPSLIKKELNTTANTVNVIAGFDLNPWQDTKIYYIGDWVKYGLNNYMCKNDNVFNIPPDISPDWEISLLNSLGSIGTIEDIQEIGSSLTDAILNIRIDTDKAHEKIGDLTSLSTPVKSDLVNAISGFYTSRGQLNGLATLDGTGKVPSIQLPSYVDDVLEFENLAAFPVLGESDKIYVDINSSISYRWSGSLYIAISSGDVDWQYVRGTPTSLSGYGILDGANIDSPVFENQITTPLIEMPYALINDISLTTASMVQTPVIIASSLIFKSTELLIQIDRGSDVHITKINIIHNGTNTWTSEYGTVFNTSSLATFSSDILGDNIRLLITPASGVTTNIKILASSIKA